MDYLRYDCLLSEILEGKKSLAGFLDTIFGFLRRKTDFYHVQKTKDDKIGFPRGIKEEILLSCMQKYEKDNLHMHAQEQHDDDEPPPVIKEVEIETTIDVEMEPPIPKTELAMIFSENDYKNGAMLDKYCWSQTLKDAELSILLPDQIKSGKHVKLDLKSNYISIKSLLPHAQDLVSGETWGKYKHNDVVWTIADGRLILSFDKLKEHWWDKLFVHEECIDVKKLDTDCPIEEYSDETQRAVEKVQSEQIKDLKTLPMSKSEQLSRLKQAWYAEDSPFKGKPFDPSVIQFN